MIINLKTVASSPYFAKPNKHTFFEAVRIYIYIYLIYFLRLLQIIPIRKKSCWWKIGQRQTDEYIYSSVLDMLHFCWNLWLGTCCWQLVVMLLFMLMINRWQQMHSKLSAIHVEYLWCQTKDKCLTHLVLSLLKTQALLFSATWQQNHRQVAIRVDIYCYFLTVIHFMTTAVQINELHQDFILKICKKIRRENSYKKKIGHCRDLHFALLHWWSFFLAN